MKLYHLYPQGASVILEKLEAEEHRLNYAAKDGDCIYKTAINKVTGSGHCYSYSKADAIHTYEQYLNYEIKELQRQLDVKETQLKELDKYAYK